MICFKAVSKNNAHLSNTKIPTLFILCQITDILERLGFCHEQNN